ncbi:hypothetical protein FRC16_009370, partial [Serendipita sp. 398]
DFIPAILKGYDVLLQDHTGTGKSLGILLALLSKPRAVRLEQPRYWKERALKTFKKTESITSILIVPHNDLAHQFAFWVKRMRLSREPQTVIQTLLRDPREEFKEQLARIVKEPPHILVTTPKALHQCWKKAKSQLMLDSVSTIVLEEADSLLKIPSNNTPLNVQKKWRKHPPVIPDLLQDVFKLRPKNSGPQEEDGAISSVAKNGKRSIQTASKKPPVQLVLVSATLRPAVRKFIFLETQWLSNQPGQTLTIEGTKAQDKRNDPVRHYGLFVDVSGRIRNIEDVEDEAGDSEQSASVQEESLEEVDRDEGEESTSEDEDEVSPTNPPTTLPENLLWTGNRLPSQLVDALVSMFVLDVPEFALLIIPSHVSALRTVEDLTELGVRAINLDDYVLKPAEILHKLKIRPKHNPVEPMDDQLADETPLESEETEAQRVIDDPIMLVAVQAAVRGIDLPLVSHVFIAGVPESDVDYMHLAGRVGRMGSKSAPNGEVKKVITFLPEPNLSQGLRGSKIVEQERKPRKDLERMWKMLGIKPSIYAKAL